MKNEIEFNWFLIGAKIANSSDEAQSEFFRGFANEVDSWETHSQKELQMIMINKKLTQKIKDILEKYLPAIYYKGEQ